MSGGELEVQRRVPRGARSRAPQFPPRQRFATFALRLGPFGSFFRDGAPVCSENDAFFWRKGGVSFCDGAYVCSENDARLRRRWNPRGNRRLAADVCSVAKIQVPVRNFCSTSGPVCFGILRRSTGLRRKRCFSEAKRGPDFGKRAPVCSENDARFRRRWNLHGNHRFPADRCSVAKIQVPVSLRKIGRLFNRQPVQQATGEQATSELATGESLRNSSGICRNPLDTNPFSSVVQFFRTLVGIPQESPRNQ